MKIIHSMLGNHPFIFGEEWHSLDASCYGFLANIFYFEIDTPLKEFIQGKELLREYIERIRILSSMASF